MSDTQKSKLAMEIAKLQDRSDADLLRECIELDEMRDHENEPEKVKELTNEIMARMEIIYKRMKDSQAQP